MKTVRLVLLERDKPEALHELRKLGLLHVETSRPSGKLFGSAASDHEAVSRAINMVPSAEAKAAAKSPIAPLLSVDESIALARRVIALEARSKAIYEESGRLGREIERCEPWGKVDPSALADLRGSGVALRFYSVEAARLPALLKGESRGATDEASGEEARVDGGNGPEPEILVLSRNRKKALIATVGFHEAAADLSKTLAEFVLPAESSPALADHLAALGTELAAVGDELLAAARQVPSMKRAAAALAQRMAFETVRESFGSEGVLAYVKGYIPAKDAPALSALAAMRGWALGLDDPAGDDMPPTKVENGKAVGTIKPVFDFLGIVPGYAEYEISPWFLVFFSLFTAMIFGDAGYGSIMFLGWLALALKSRRTIRAEGLSAPLRLFLLISVLTMAWGAATGTWFSLSASNLPSGLRDLAIWPISSANPGASKNIQIFCFLLGSFQLVIARVKNIVRDFPNPKFLAQLGSLALIVGMLFLVLYLVVDSKRFPVPPYAVWFVAGGFLANIVFGAYEGNILRSFLEGLKNIIPTFLSSVGVFADIVSYIRLWALGLAGSSLATIINTMGGGLVKPALIGLMGVVILVFGHGLNVVLGVLSVVVHAIRLNVLEFSCNHLGMQWSGIEYDPFRITVKEEA
jgi:V/A-type H+-transporting ATPase subunit I